MRGAEMTARRIILIALSVTLVCCGGGAGVAIYAWTGQIIDTTGKVNFVHRLPTPPLAPSHVDSAGRRVFELTAQQGEHDFGQGAVRTSGYNGSYLGPTIRATRGEQIAVNVHNDLADTTTVHWHGMHLPAIMDGGPRQPVPAGSTWSPNWQIDQPAATLWYHPHPHGESADQVYRGLAGMFIVDDPSTDVAALPHRYGVDDVPVIVQDKKFDGDGQLDNSRSLLGGVGVLGDTIAVNGMLAPYLEVTTERIRLRLLNASNARVYAFGFADGRAFDLVGTDGGLLDSPYRTSHVDVSPGERAEIVVTVRPGERTVLRSIPPDLGLDSLSNRFTGAADTFDVLQLRAGTSLAASPAIPPRLVEVPRLDRSRAVATHDFQMADQQINGSGMDMSRVDVTSVRSTVEIWRPFNNDGSPHNFHVHGLGFQVLSVGGRQPPPELRGWKDTLFLRPHTRYEIIMTMPSYADPSAPYMFHCHLLYHEDQGMMGQFVVVEPGQRAGTPVHQHQ